MPRKIGNLLHLSNSLEPLRLELDQQSAVTERVRAALASDASAHLVAARIRGTELVLYVDSPAWATRLRLQGPSLLRDLNGRQITARTVLTRVVVPAGTRPATAGATLSEGARSALTEAAKGTSDDALKASLLRLSRRCRTTPQCSAK
jgi:hypothetical protein